MKKMILLVALIIGTQATWAKAPAEAESSVPMEHIYNTEGKIQAAMLLQKENRVRGMKIQVLELLQRVSTVEKLNIDREYKVDVSEAIHNLKDTENMIENLDIFTTKDSRLNDIQDSLIDLADSVESLTLEL
ncbi:MAG: hypothetical protein BM556_18030 [Bacteriovorax sp. MedPE-SWde]|nr:MAG: hypothetical protein BM556_18030 [Bacteriovorax sp. MedPE-SWde]